MLLRISLLMALLPAFLLSELTFTDIHKQMDDVFKHHLTERKMTGKIIALSLKNYIEQFDPYHVYLTAEDVRPYFDLPNAKLERLVQEYEASNFSIFEKINGTFQKAILKMRKFREAKLTLESNFSRYGTSAMPASVDTFVKTDEELEARQAVYFASLIVAEVATLKSLNKPASFQTAREIAEANLDLRENAYLFRDRQGKPLDPIMKESLIAEHILEACMTSLDVHSQYLTKEMAKNLAMKLEKQYVGIGVNIVAQGESYFISGLVKGGVAERSRKIEVGDELVAIDGKKVSTMNSQELQASLQGAQGSDVTLSMKREDGKSITIVLTREQITIKEGRVDTKYQKVPGGILATIQLHGFYQGQGELTSEQDMINAIETLQKVGPIKGIVLDLRDNQGGFLSQAIKVAGLFIRTGVVVVAKDSEGKLFYFRDEDPKQLYSGPLVILVSRETASAAEIVAQTLKDYGVAVVVGDDHTFGKGSLQMENVTRNREGEGASTVTVGRYYTVSGASPQSGGVKADIFVPSVLSQSKIGEEYVKGTLKADSIPPSYNDSLGDLPPAKMIWYQLYYLPYLEQKTDRFRRWIPELRKKSEERLSKDNDYQELLKGKGKSDLLQKKQLDEAANITKDLIQLSH